MSLIKKPSELQIIVTLRALIYGQPGIGKTTLGLSAPNVLVIDCDGGIHRVKAEHLKDTVQVGKWEDCLALLDEDLSAYNTLVVDTAGKAIDFLTRYIIEQEPRLKQGDGTLSLKGYGVRKSKFNDFLNRVTALGKNVIFIAHEREEKDGDNRYVRPEIGGSSGNDLMKDLDLVGYVESYNNKRTISFNATDKFYGKNTANLPPRMDIPDYTGKQAAFMGEIIERYRQMVGEKMSRASEYNTLLDTIEANIEMIEDADSANEQVEKILSLEHIWDSKAQAAARIQQKAKSLGLVFDKSIKPKGKYINPTTVNNGNPQTAEAGS